MFFGFINSHLLSFGCAAGAAGAAWGSRGGRGLAAWHREVGNNSTRDVGRYLEILSPGTVEVLSREALLQAAMKGPAAARSWKNRGGRVAGVAGGGGGGRGCFLEGRGSFRGSWVRGEGSLELCFLSMRLIRWVFLKVVCCFKSCSLGLPSVWRAPLFCFDWLLMHCEDFFGAHAFGCVPVP